jgi:SDR family mycofactocin-dependent oxidoreductase
MNEPNGKVAGKVALVTGAARGQGKSHAVRLAEEGADLILIDAAKPIDGIAYDMPTAGELEATAEQIRKMGKRVHAYEVDVRDLAGLEAAVGGATADLGRLDVVVANAGVLSPASRTWEMPPAQWQTVVDINLTGVWHTVRATIGRMVEFGHGGSVILISSIAGLRGIPNHSNYVAAKHGLGGLAGSLANEVAEFGIRVNTVHPTNVRTPMIDNPSSAKHFRPDLSSPTLEDGRNALTAINLLPVPWVSVADVSSAVLWLASDESRYVTGASIPIDAGMLAKFTG